MSRLGEVVRAKIDAGVVPRERPDKVFSGSGDGKPCTVCDVPILTNQVQWSIQAAGGVSYRFHIGCHGIWEAHLRKAGASSTLADGRRRG